MSEASRLELIEARIAIADLVHTYARNIRAGKGGDCLALFTEDGVFEVREAPLGSSGAPHTRTRLEGHDAILAYLTNGASSEVRVCPMIHNLLIQVNGREAESSSVMRAIVSNGQGLFGEYQDRFRYEDRWLFSSRVFTILGDLPAPAADAGSR